MTSTEKIDTPRVEVSTGYHGVTVSESYRWLEDAASAETKAWTAAQNARTRAVLDGLPAYRGCVALSSISPRPRRWLGAGAATDQPSSRARGGRGRRTSSCPNHQAAAVPLSALRDLDAVAGARVVVDPNVIDGDGLDDDRLVRALPGRCARRRLPWSSHGTEEGTLHLFEIASGERVDVMIPRVQGGTAGGSLAWAGDSSGFWYTRGPAPGERPDAELAFFQEVWHHVIGQPLDPRPPHPPRPACRPEDRPAPPAGVAGWALGDGPGAERRQWRVAGVSPPAARRRLVAGRGDLRQMRRGGLR